MVGNSREFTKRTVYETAIQMSTDVSWIARKRSANITDPGGSQSEGSALSRSLWLERRSLSAWIEGVDREDEGCAAGRGTSRTHRRKRGQVMEGSKRTREAQALRRRPVRPRLAARVSLAEVERVFPARAGMNRRRAAVFSIYCRVPRATGEGEVPRNWRRVWSGLRQAPSGYRETILASGSRSARHPSRKLCDVLPSLDSL